MMKRWISLSLLLIAIIVSACEPTPEVEVPVDAVVTGTWTPTVEVTPTATPDPPKTLTICSKMLPEGLFLYDGVQSVSETNILALLQEEGLESVDGELAAGILQKVPAQADGDLRLEAAAVQAGQMVVDAYGSLVVMKAGVTVRPAGCRTADCAVTWDGQSPLEMDRMVVEFVLKDGLTWSDGTAVSAADSQLSYRLASALDTPGLKWAEDRTDTYLPLDLQRIQWRGKPGFTTWRLDRLFWKPLPSHRFNENDPWQMLAEDPLLTTNPLSYGPFVVSGWEDNSLRLLPNPHYYGLADGLPLLDEVVFRYVDGDAQAAWAALQSGVCDVLDSSFNLVNFPAVLDEIRVDERFTMAVEDGRSWTQLVFGIKPASDDDNDILPLGGRPHLLGDPRIRQAIFHCLDREAMQEETVGDLGYVWPSFLPFDESRLDPASQLSYDPAQGVALLGEAGWQDGDGDPQTPLQAWNVTGVPAGTPLSFELLVSSSGFHQDLAQSIQQALNVCGIGVTVTSLPPEDLYAPGPAGPLFGRQFDLALMAWQPDPAVDCRFYLSWEIPSGANDWIGTNIAGLEDPAFDAACLNAAQAIPGELAEGLRGAEAAFLAGLPAVPLFSIPNVMVIPANGCDKDVMTSEHEFINRLNQFDPAAGCP